MERITKEFVTSLITVALVILAIAVFISSGARMVFYIIVVITILFGFYNAWLISNSEIIEEGPAANITARKKSPKRRRRRKR